LGRKNTAAGFFGKKILDFLEGESRLLKNLVARAFWKLFGVHGYAGFATIGVSILSVRSALTQQDEAVLLKSSYKLARL